MISITLVEFVDLIMPTQLPGATMILIFPMTFTSSWGLPHGIPGTIMDGTTGITHVLEPPMAGIPLGDLL